MNEALAEQGTDVPGVLAQNYIIFPRCGLEIFLVEGLFRLPEKGLGVRFSRLVLFGWGRRRRRRWWWGRFGLRGDDRAWRRRRRFRFRKEIGGVELFSLLVEESAFAGDAAEGAGDARQALRVAEEQVALRLQAAAKTLEDRFDGGGAKVDHDVAAEDDVDIFNAGGRVGIGVGLEVEVGEAHPFSDRLDEAVAAAGGREVSVDHLLIHDTQGARPVEAFLGGLQRSGIDVGAEDVDVPVREMREMFLQKNGQAVGLFAGGAAGRPQAQGAPLAVARQQFRKDRFLQSLELGEVTEEVGLADGQQGQKFLQLAAASGMGAQVVEVVAMAANAGGAHAAHQAALEDLPVALVEVQAAVTVDQVLERFEGCPVHRGVGAARPLGVLDEQGQVGLEAGVIERLGQEVENIEQFVFEVGLLAGDDQGGISPGASAFETA